MNTNLNPPSFGPKQPVYPPLLQLIRVTAGTVSGPSGGSSAIPAVGTLYVSFTQQARGDTLFPRDRESCLVFDPNGSVPAPGYYLGRLSGSWTSLPVYEIVPSASGGGGGTVTFTGTVTITNTGSLVDNGPATFNGPVTTGTAGITLPNSGAASSNPSSGNLVLYQVGGVTFIKNSSGVATPLGVQPIILPDDQTILENSAFFVNVVGQWSSVAGTIGASVGVTAADILLVPFVSLWGQYVKFLGIQALALVGCKFRVGIYACNAPLANLARQTPIPTTLVADFGETTLVMGNNGVYGIAAPSVVELSPNRLYFAALMQDTTTALAAGVSTLSLFPTLGYTAVLGGDSPTAITLAGGINQNVCWNYKAAGHGTVYGALPATLAPALTDLVTTATAAIPAILTVYGESND